MLIDIVVKIQCESVIIDVLTICSPTNLILITIWSKNVKVNRRILKINCGLNLESSCILHRNYIALSKESIGLFYSRFQLHFLAYLISYTTSNWLKKTAPGTSWEVKIISVKIDIINFVSNLNCWSYHIIRCNILIRTLIFWELKEKRLHKHRGSISIANIWKNSIVVSNQRILSLYCYFHPVTVWFAFQHCFVIDPRLLTIDIIIVTMSIVSWKRQICSYMVLFKA